MVQFHKTSCSSCNIYLMQCRFLHWITTQYLNSVNILKNKKMFTFITNLELFWKEKWNLTKKELAT